MRVTVYGYGGGVIGTIRLAGRRLIPEPLDNRVLAMILLDPVLVEDARGRPQSIRADREPEKFLQALAREYSGSALRVSEVEEA